MFVHTSFSHVELRGIYDTVCVKVSHLVHLSESIISIFKEDNVFSMTANLPYGPLMNTDIVFYRTFFGLFIVSVTMLVVRCLLGEEKPVLAL